jgi:hypothetical protein
MSRFMDKLGIEAMTDRMGSIVRGANADYGLGMILKAITLGVISGSRHLSDVVRLGMDEALMKTQGWKSFPVLSSITRVMETPERDGVRFAIPEYSYGPWVTNLGLTPLKTEQFHNKRAVTENLIGAGKNQMACCGTS